MQFLIGDFNVKVRRENIFKPAIGNDSLNQDCNDNNIRIVYFTNQNIYLFRARCSCTEIFVYTL
jgi:hypothetical protein